MTKKIKNGWSTYNQLIPLEDVCNKRHGGHRWRPDGVEQVAAGAGICWREERRSRSICSVQGGLET
jgi:hypothetical protein